MAEQFAEADEYDDYEPCDHQHDDDCYDYQGFWRCEHTHCFNCGGCNCPGYCDDHQTYNLRPAETGGAPDALALDDQTPGETGPTKRRDMSFSFNAVGTAAEVAEQLASVETDNVLGARLAETLGELLGDPDGQPEGWNGGEFRYVVKAFGHSGKSSALTLNASVEVLWVPVVPREITVLPEEIDGELIPEAGLADED